MDTVEQNFAIELKHITKTFGPVVANDDISLSVKQGEILALLGENGSGKTTLMNMLSGIYHPDSGTIYVRGERRTIASPHDALSLGIGMIHQHFKLVDVFTAQDNIVMGTEKDRRLRKKALAGEITSLCQKYGLEIDPLKKTYNMSVSEKQTVEILKVLYRGADILILDEPTAVLTPQETDKLLTILRKGKSVATVATAETNAQELTELMVGKKISLQIERPCVKQEKALFEVHHLSVRNEDGVYALNDISFDLNGGEILGVAGVAGSGQKELCETVAGLMHAEKGAILYKKENIVGKSPREIIKMGISMSFIPEDRLGMGLVASMGMTDNMLLKSYKNGKSPFINKKPARELALRLIDTLEIVTPGVTTPVSRLSGGNVQKVLLGREIESEPQLLITAYPVRGLDINSSYTIYDLLNEQKKKGVAVLFIGEDLDVLLELCDRIMVLCHGAVTGILEAQSATKEQIGLLMAGETIKKEADAQ